MRTIPILAALLPFLLAAPTHAQDAALIAKGEAVAVAADCAGCHMDRKSGALYSGGLALASPMGDIHVRNITPDPGTGIGGWSFADFEQAIRNGKSKNVGYLFPAMPYTSYRFMSDEDLKALYAFFMKGVKPVEHAVPQTDLGFPFVRPAMIVWNTFFLNNEKPVAPARADAKVLRGQYLVQVLGHCGECHTPRGMMMQSRSGDALLSGGDVAGWRAPNITSDASGIGEVPDAELKAFLKTGKTTHRIAGGDMGDAIRRSLSTLPDNDIEAMVAFLKATTPVRTAKGAPIVKMVAPLDLAKVEQPLDRSKAADASTTDGAKLYLAACASCHGVDGELKSGTRPSLRLNATVRAASPNNVIQSIAYGVNLGRLDTTSLMLPFRASLSEAQIASVASYVRQRFGGIQGAVTTQEATDIMKGRIGVPWLIRNARILAWLGVAAAVVLAALGLIVRARRRPSTS